jgi:dihydroflavonol-4-reductase
MRVAVTGGSGVVGRAVVSHLVEGGFEVVATSRSATADQTLTDLGATPVRAELAEYESLVAAFRGAERVFHIAGMNAMCVADPVPMWEANIDGTLDVAEAAVEAGVSRLVYTSSAAVLGERQGTVGDEDSEHRGSFLSRYEESKYLAERALLDLDPGIEVVIVNPSSVQGPGRASGTGELILDVINGRLRVLADTSLSIVDIDDCARGHLLAAEHGRDRRRYVLNSFTFGAVDAVEMISSVIGGRLDVRFVPPWLVRAAAPLADFLRWLRIPIPFCGEMIATVAHGHRYDGTRASEELGLEYTEPGPFMERLVEWFRSEGLTNR